MEELLEQLLNDEFEGLRGSRLEGTICFSDEVVNGLIGSFIGQDKPPSSPPSGEASPDFRKAMKYIRVDRLEWKTEQGRAAISVKASIEIKE